MTALEDAASDISLCSNNTHFPNFLFALRLDAELCPGHKTEVPFKQYWTPDIVRLRQDGDHTQ